MEEIIIKKNKTGRKIYVNSTTKICSIPQEKSDELVSVYSVVVENLISKSIKRKAQKKS